MATKKAIIKVGISSCLLGEEVRYNREHKHYSLCTSELAQYFEFVSTCPELVAGLGVPRPAIRLVGTPDAPRAVRVIETALISRTTCRFFCNHILMTSA